MDERNNMNEKQENKDVKKSPLKEYFSCFKMNTKSIAYNAIIAALYVILTYAFFFCSYGAIQVRVSEMLMILVFFNPNYTVGLTIGCLLANIYSVTAGLTAMDMLFGTLATFISCILISVCKHLLFACLIPAFINGIVIGSEITFLFSNLSDSREATILWFTNFGYVTAGEIIAISVIGYTLFMFAIKGSKRKILDVIHAKRNLDFRF